MSYQLYHGSCHCQAVKYKAEFDIAAGSTRCNCSLCSKSRAWILFVQAGKFELLAGDNMLSTYEWVPPGHDAPSVAYRFCSRCGVRLFATGVHKGERFYAIHVPTVDDLDREELVRAPLRFQDGAHDRIDRAPADTRLM